MVLVLLPGAVSVVLAAAAILGVVVSGGGGGGSGGGGRGRGSGGRSRSGSSFRSLLVVAAISPLSCQVIHVGSLMNKPHCGLECATPPHPPNFTTPSSLVRKCVCIVAPPKHPVVCVSYKQAGET